MITKHLVIRRTVWATLCLAFGMFRHTEPSGAKAFHLFSLTFITLEGSDTRALCLTIPCLSVAIAI